ncbi:ABC transporter ATP-binding protein/permease [bacterium]|nr:ABC transporter ATP-binding protein/permease [bacterium]MDB4379558.1 ABC transporter ATP-binding protein/permease [bacterium]
MKQFVHQPSSPALGNRAVMLGIWRHLNRRRRQQLGVALITMLASGVAEVGSLAAAVPFLSVLSDPQSLWRLSSVQTLSDGLGISSAEELLLPVTLLFGLAAVLAAAVRLFNLWLNRRLAAAIGSDLSCEAYKRTLYQPYSVHLQRNSSAVLAAITTQIGQTVSALNLTLQLATSTVVAIGILGALLAVDWIVACTAVAVFGVAYILMWISVRWKLASNSQLIAAAVQEQLKCLQEGLGAIRDVLLDSNQNTFIEIYQRADRPMRLRVAENGFLAASPRYGLEALGLLLIALLALQLSWQREDSMTVIPLLGTLALGSQRLLPALQQIYRSWAAIHSYGAGVNEVLIMLKQPLPREYLLATPSSLSMKHAVHFESLSFRYGQETPWVLYNLELKIHRGERVGLIGSTGSGKSTLVDLLMGLLEPTNGRILIDGADLHDPNEPSRLPAWRAAIAHVPQNIFLSDNSIAENIAFGIPKKDIDLDRLFLAARQAQISGFIESIPGDYSTLVGERGVRLSGGQRQRIGIARALYKQANIIILDEATSALDSSTEDEVMKCLDGLSDELTVIMIAHRLSTLSSCDRIFKLSQGAPISVTTPSELL